MGWNCWRGIGNLFLFFFSYLIPQPCRQYPWQQNERAIYFDSTVSGRYYSLSTKSAGCFYRLRSIFSCLLEVMVVRLSLLAKTKTSAERFCNKDYSLHSSFTHKWVFLCPPEYFDWGYLIFLQDVYIYTWNPRGEGQAPGCIFSFSSSCLFLIIHRWLGGWSFPFI